MFLKNFMTSVHILTPIGPFSHEVSDTQSEKFEVKRIKYLQKLLSRSFIDSAVKLQSSFASSNTDIYDIALKLRDIRIPCQSHSVVYFSNKKSTPIFSAFSFSSKLG